MVSTAIAISPEALEVECCQRRVDELTEVITSHSLRFCRIALNQLGNAADAEDAVQDAFLSALTHMGQFKGQARMSTWLTTIVINSARTKLRRRLSQVQIPLDETGDKPNVSLTGTTRPRTGVSQARNCGNTRSCNLAPFAYFAQNLSTVRCRGLEHPRNCGSPRNVSGNSKSTTRESSYEAQTSDQEELPRKCEAIDEQSRTGIHGGRARRKICATTDLLKDQSFCS